MSPRESRFLHLAGLAALWAVLILPSLGSTSLWDIDEGLNAEAAREMMESGNWIVPSFNFQPRTAKPALLYWLQVGSYRAFGVNEFAARLPSALAALGVTALTYWLGRRMFDPLTGLLAAIVLLTSIQVCALAHAATPDMLLLLGVMLALSLFWWGYERDKKTWLIITSLGTALAVLAKGPVGLLMPTGVIGLFLLTRGETRLFLNRRFFIGLLIFCAIALPWYVLVGSETRGAFLRGFWWNENVNRFLEPLDRHAGPIYFYPLVLILGLAPWSIFLIPTIWQNCIVARNPVAKERLASRFLLIWVATYFLFFSAAATKLPNYILPTYPALALLTAFTIRQWQRGELTLPAWVMPTSLASLSLVGVITIAGLFFAGGGINLAALKGNIFPGLQTWAVIGVIPLLGGAAAWWFNQRHQRIRATVVVAGVAAVYLALILSFPVRLIDTHKAPRNLIAAAGLPNAKDEIRIASFDYFQPSLVFYAQREITTLQKPEQAIEFLEAPLPAYLILPANTWDQLSVFAPQCKALARHRDLYRNMDVVVVSNR